MSLPENSLLPSFTIWLMINWSFISPYLHLTKYPKPILKSGSVWNCLGPGYAKSCGGKRSWLCNSCSGRFCNGRTCLGWRIMRVSLNKIWDTDCIMITITVTSKLSHYFMVTCPQRNNSKWCKGPTLPTWYGEHPDNTTHYSLVDYRDNYLVGYHNMENYTLAYHI